jgi:DNA-binding NarL/FixJ family response regulator
MNKKLKIYIADDHTLFRKAMVNLLSTFSGVSSIKDVENGKDLLSLVKKDPPDVALVDLQMPVMNGIETCQVLLTKYPGIKVIVLTMFDAEEYILAMIEMGVHAFLLKNTEPEELEKAINSVVENDFYHNELIASVLRKSVKEKTAAPRPLLRNVELSEREREILSLICNELTIREIGLRLSLSENTVRNHRVKIMDKVGVKNTVGLVKFAYEIGLLS